MNSLRLAALVCLLLPVAVSAQGTLQFVKPEVAPPAEPLRLPVRTAPAEQAYIYSRATGLLAERRVDLGDVVQAGDVLAVIAAPEIQRAAERTAAAVAQAAARAELAEANVRRTRALGERAMLSSAEAEIGEANAKTAAADLLAAQADAKRLAELVAFQQIRAPFDALVVNRQFDRGDFIPGDSTTNGRWLFHLARVNELRGLLDVAPATALALRSGQDATVEFTELPGKKFPAKVARAAGLIDAASGTMRVELTLPNPERQIPAGLNGVALITPTANANARLLRVPVNAIVVREGRQHVAINRDGKVAFVPVRTGRNSGARIEILEGIAADASIIVNPNGLLQEGQPVPASPLP